MHPPQGRPSWDGNGDLELIYLGWGRRDFALDPLSMHCDHATNYYILMRGKVAIHLPAGEHTVRGPVAILFHPECAFGLSQTGRTPADILVWVWRNEPLLPDLRPEPRSFRVLDLQADKIDSLSDLHARSRSEVARADCYLPRTLAALRELVEVEILRAGRELAPAEDFRWKLAKAWMQKNLAIHAPVPALCDYLRMSPNTLHRFFKKQTGLAPGTYFRLLKLNEARRLIEDEQWQVKAVAYHLGYRHPNDLSRALRDAVK